MSIEDESIYAAMLYKLGFEPVEKRPPEADNDSKQVRLEVEDITLPPWCIKMPHVTFVTDETRQIWKGPAGADISRIPCTDITADYQRYRKSMRS